MSTITLDVSDGLIQIVDEARDEAKPVLTDWDYPGVAQTFGWGMRRVQHQDLHPEDEDSSVSFDYKGESDGGFPCCHRHTDGTVDCPDCKVTAINFINAAYEWLCDNDGATADDPGYFSEGVE